MPDDPRAVAHAATVAGDSVGDTLPVASDRAHAETVAGDNVTVGDTLAAPPGAASPRKLSLGGQHANFICGRELARGGMGRIVIAQDRRLGRTVALKLLQRVSPALRARFEREAHITARLAHPAIVPVYEVGELADGEPFYAMKLIEGTPLDETIAKATTLPARLGLLSSAMAVCEALAYAHSKRVIHRDLKPANVLVGKFGETVVIDWGLAKDLVVGSLEPGVPADRADPRDSNDSQGVTLDGEVVGTPSYMPPEQAAGAAVDERADVYALGALLYHVVAGRPPYRGRTAGEILAAIDTGPPPAIGELEPAVPDDLASIIAKAMAREPDARYPSAGELADELRRFIDGRLVASHRYSGAELIRRWVRRHRTAVAVGAVAAAVLAIGGTVSVRQIVLRGRETERALAESQLEHGRQLLVDGNPGQAAPYLAAGLAHLPDDAVAHRLAAIALRDLPRRLGDFAGTAAAFRRDGRELALGQADGSIVVLDPATGTTLRTLPRSGGTIAQLAYAPDGARLAVATTTGADLRDAATGARVVIASATPCTEVRVLPQGDRVAIACATAVTISGLDGKVVATDPVVEPHALALSVDGTRLVAISHASAIAWTTADLARTIEVPAVDVTRYAAAIERDGTVLTGGTDGLRRWSSPTQAATLVTDQVVALSWLDDHTLLADGRLVRIDTGEVRVLTRASVQAATIIDRTHAITGGYDRTLRIWDLERIAHPVVVLDAEVATSALLVDPTGHRAISRGDRAEARVELWDVAKVRAPNRTAVVGTRIQAIIADHRDRIAVRSVDGAAHPTKLLTAALQPIATLDDGWPMGFRPNADEVVTDRDGMLSIYSARDGAHLRDITEPTKIWQLAFSRTGRTIATSSEHRVSLRDTDWRVIASFEAPPDITTLAVDDHERVITGHDDGTLRIWNARTGVLLGTAKGHTAHIASIELRDATVVTASWDLTMRQWAFPSGEPRGIVRSFDTIVNIAAIAPNGSLFATADGSTAVNVWDTAHGRLLEQIPTAGELVTVVFLDGDHLVTGDLGGRVELVDLSERSRTVDEITRLVATSPRWQLLEGRAVERR